MCKKWENTKAVETLFAFCAMSTRHRIYILLAYQIAHMDVR